MNLINVLSKFTASHMPYELTLEILLLKILDTSCCYPPYETSKCACSINMETKANLNMEQCLYNRHNGK
jgi:hypothetical protein